MVRDVSRAVVITAAGGPERLSVVQIDTPEPAPDEVLVEVEVAGLNFLDVMDRRGADGGRGGRVVGAVSSPRKQRAAIEAGAARATDYASAVRVARELTDGIGVDVVYDSVGAPTFDDSLAAVRTRGIVVVYGSAGGPVAPLDISRLGAAGSIMLARTRLAHVSSGGAELMGRSARLFDDLRRGQVTLELFATFGLDGIADAHRAIESRSTIGKILLTP